MTKNEWREYFTKERKLITTVEREEKSRLIAERLFSLSLYKQSSSIFVFIGMENEIDTQHIISRAMQDGKLLAAPRVLSKKNGMAFYRFEYKSRFVRSKFGVLEPEGEVSVQPDGKTIIVTPGLAFDTQLYRIGYGGGFYDRYLQDTVCLAKIGISYDFQYVPEIPKASYDVPVSILITEKNIYRRC